jgi:enolase-phosphatase E1
MKTYLFDIEGTTSDINFVHKILFPYSAQRLQSFVLEHQQNPLIQKALWETRETLRWEQKKITSLYEQIDFLLTCIRFDRKFPPLKTIQGLIWEQGYLQGDFKGHVYPDVEPFWQKILSSKNQIAIYSSGSVKAQKLLFQYSSAGDLTPLISAYFDTQVGHKRESKSYSLISQQLKQVPQDIFFFSDIREELIAAQHAGFHCYEIQRNNKTLSPFKVLSTFSSWDNEL